MLSINGAFYAKEQDEKTTCTTSPPASTQLLAIEASANRLSIGYGRWQVVAERQHLAAHGHAVGIVPLSIETLRDAA